MTPISPTFCVPAILAGHAATSSPLRSQTRRHLVDARDVQAGEVRRPGHALI